MKNNIQTNPTSFTHVNPLYESKGKEETNLGKGGIKVSTEKESNPTPPVNRDVKFKMDFRAKASHFFTKLSVNIATGLNIISDEKGQKALKEDVSKLKLQTAARYERKEESIIAKAPIKFSAIADEVIDNVKTGKKTVDTANLAKGIINKGVTDRELRSANISHLLNEVVDHYSEKGKLDEKKFDAFLTNFLLDNTSGTLNSINTRELEEVGAKMLEQGRDNVGLMLFKMADAITESRTLTGATRLFGKLVPGSVEPQRTLSEFMRKNDVHSRALTKMLEAQGMNTYAKSMASNIMNMSVEDAKVFNDFSEMISKKREVREFKEGKPNGKVNNSKISNIKDDGITKEEANAFMVCGAKFIDLIATTQPNEALKNQLKELKDEIQDKVGDLPGQISQDEANQMIHQLYTNCVFLRTFSVEAAVAFGDLKDSPLSMRDGPMAILRFVGVMSNNALRSESDIYSQSVKDELITARVPLANKIDDFLCDVWGMPETSRFYPS